MSAGMDDGSGGANGGGVQLVCNACQCVVEDSARQDHYRSEWHRYNVKRRVNNLAPITNDVFQQKLVALNEQKVAGEAEKTASKCKVCGNVFQSQKAYANHLLSKKHLKKVEKKAQSQANTQPGTPLASAAASSNAAAGVPPLAGGVTGKPVLIDRVVPLSAAPVPAADQKVAAPIASAAAAAAVASVGAPVIKTLKPKSAKPAAAAATSKDSKGGDDEDEDDDGAAEDLSGFDPKDTLPLGSCFFCSKYFAAKPPKPAAAAAAAAAATSDSKSAPAPAPAAAAKDVAEKQPAVAAAEEPKGDVEAALDHMAKAHGFFIPYLEYCTDVHGLVGYLCAKVGMGRVCLYCDGRGRSRYPTFQAVAQHMTAKGHCKIRFEENDVDEEVLEFYEFPDRDGDGDDDDEANAKPAAAAAAGAAGAAAGAMIVIDDGKSKQLSTAVAGSVKPRQTPTINENGELVIGDGTKVIGHRDLKRYYTQNARPAETRESVLINRLVSSYKLLALPGYSASGVITPKLKKAQKAARSRQGAYNEKVATNSNLLIRKHFRVSTALG